MSVRVVDTKDRAVKTFKTFYARDYAEEIELPFTWPSQMQEVGVGGAEMYRSNKWMKDLSEHDDYKHVDEGPRTVYVEPGWILDARSRPLPVFGPMVQFQEPMPKHFTRLGPLLGVQVRLFRKDKDGELFVPKGSEGRCEITVARGMLGAAEHPKTRETFLFVYTDSGVHMLLTGNKLSIEKDGITG